MIQLELEFVFLHALLDTIEIILPDLVFYLAHKELLLIEIALIALLLAHLIRLETTLLGHANQRVLSLPMAILKFLYV